MLHLSGIGWEIDSCTQGGLKSPLIHLCIFPSNYLELDGGPARQLRDIILRPAGNPDALQGPSRASLPGYSGHRHGPVRQLCETSLLLQSHSVRPLDLPSSPRRSCTLCRLLPGVPTRRHDQNERKVAGITIVCARKYALRRANGDFL